MTRTVGDRDVERQSSPPTRRVVEVMATVVDHPNDPPTLAEIVRATGIPRGTAHAIVTQLCRLGWLTRRDHTFRPGLEFLSVARRAARLDVLAIAAVAAMQQLVERTGVPAFLAQRTAAAVDRDAADQIVMTDQILPPGAPDLWTPPLQRMPLRPPLCREFVAWSAPDDRDQWLEHAPADQRRRLTAVLGAVSERGYAIERTTGAHRAIIDTLGSLDEIPADLRDRMSELVSELSAIDYLPGELVDRVGVVSIGAPIFAADGEVIAAIVACPDTTLAVDAVADLGAATRAAADTVTAALAH